MYNTRLLLSLLLEAGFVLKRNNGGHARYHCGAVNIDVPVHKREQSPAVAANIRKAIQRALAFHA